MLVVGVKDKSILVNWTIMRDGNEEKPYNQCKKAIGNPICIGRTGENDVNPLVPYVSAKHGVITSATKYLGIQTVVSYTDSSKFGTYYLPPGIEDLSKVIKIHSNIVEIKSGCRLFIFDPHKPFFGISMHVLF